MQDTKLFETILGLERPWRIERVALDATEERVDLWLEHAPEVRWSCPECATALPCRDHSEERVWRHLDTCQFQTFLHARVPRVECPHHGVRQVRVSWAEDRSRFTALRERLIIDLIQQCGTVTGAGRIARISWDEAWGVMRRAVARGQARKPRRPIRYVGVDEKSFRKAHHYHTVVCDLERSTVEYVAPDRRVESLAPYFAGLTTAQRTHIEAVAMDMWDPYIRATREGLPAGAERIVFDRFHVMRDITTAVDLVRKREHRALQRDGESVLAKTKYLWLYAEEHLPEKHRAAFDTLRQLDLKVGRAGAIKESLRKLWDYRQFAAALRYFTRWYGWARRSRLDPIRRVAATLRRHQDGVLRYVQHPITNGVAEGLNSKIMSINRKACGFRNPDHFATAIYFHCGGLDLYPRSCLSGCFSKPLPVV